MQYKGTYSNLFEALKAFPNGAADDDFVVISDKIYRWSKRRGTFVTDNVHVPEIPDRSPVITLFTELTSSGILTDHMGNKWQLQPWAERVSVPVITLADVTEEEFPTLVGKREAMWLITLTHEDSEAEIWYKVVKNGDEPEAYSKYVEPFSLKNNGNYQIVCKAKKEGVTDSEVVRSETFKVSRLVVQEAYYKPQITAFSYTDFPASGDTKNPTLIYLQAGERRYTDGYIEALTPITEGATFSFSATAGLGIAPNTGGLTVPESRLPERHKVGTVSVIVTMHGISSDVKECHVYQLAAAKSNNRVNWIEGLEPPHDVDSGTLLYAGIDFKAEAVYGGEVSYYYKDGTMEIPITTGITINKETIIGAKVAETTYYKSARIESTVYVKEVVRVYFGHEIDQTTFEAIVNNGDGADLVSSRSSYPWGQLKAPNNAINEQINAMANQVVWIATDLQSRPNVILEQNGYPATLSWIEADANFYEQDADGTRRYYSFYYVVMDVEGNTLLRGITW